ncbi:hypothetical protein PQR37_35760 [Paraburkholderia nemoris]|uniref:hypothetical protein n=1 Tax=Paraburkholderia nemoris TaxID=2793076 RepID=UPI0038BC2623
MGYVGIVPAQRLVAVRACCAALIWCARFLEPRTPIFIHFSLMNMKFTTLASAAFLSLALAGCGHSEIDTVKAAIVPQDSTHTYETALSNRDSCEKDSWRTLKDDTNRTVVEYRCDLKNGAALLAAFRQQKIADTQHDFRGYFNGLDQTAGNIQNPEQLEKQLADAQNLLAQLQANGAPSAETPEALKQGIVNREGAMEVAQSAVERAQRELDDARSNQTGVQQERARFAQAEKDTLAQIDRTYGNVTQASEVFQWFVRDTDVVPTWSGVELTKQDGNTVRQDRGWQQTMWDLLNHRGDDHVHAVLNVPDNIVPGQ